MNPTELSEDWRHKFPPVERARQIIQKVETRRLEGEKNFGNCFHGNPLEHLEQELIDALFYIQSLQRRMKEEYPQILKEYENHPGCSLD